MSYPAFDRNWKKFGRVKNLKVVGPHLILQIDGETVQMLYKEEFEAIKLNDWVAFDERSQLIQVAPALRVPVSTAVDIKTLHHWNQFLKVIRKFFENRNFLEIQTPSLVICPGTEPTIDIFSTELNIGSQVQKVFLPTSPELHLKKALVLGFDRIYEIAKCYRNNELTKLHQPEFWMLEWYRSFANLFDLQADVVKLIFQLCDQLGEARPVVKCFTIRQLFRQHLDFDLKPDTTGEELKKLAIQAGLRVTESFSTDDIFFLLMLEKIEPLLPYDCLVFVEKYPPYQAALARRDHEGWAERFEVYWKGMELANAFDELNDPVEQRSRSQEDLLKREKRKPIQLDEEFFQALESGMPPSAGIALGLERLFMALSGISEIDKTRLFPVKSY